LVRNSAEGIPSEEDPCLRQAGSKKYEIEYFCFFGTTHHSLSPYVSPSWRGKGPKDQGEGWLLKQGLGYSGPCNVLLSNNDVVGPVVKGLHKTQGGPREIVIFPDEL